MRPSWINMPLSVNVSVCGDFESISKPFRSILDGIVWCEFSFVRFELFCRRIVCFDDLSKRAFFDQEIRRGPGLAAFCRGISLKTFPLLVFNWLILDKMRWILKFYWNHFDPEPFAGIIHWTAIHPILRFRKQQMLFSFEVWSDQLTFHSLFFFSFHQIVSFRNRFAIFEPFVLWQHFFINATPATSVCERLRIFRLSDS